MGVLYFWELRCSLISQDWEFVLHVLCNGTTTVMHNERHALYGIIYFVLLVMKCLPVINRINCEIFKLHFKGNALVKQNEWRDCLRIFESSEVSYVCFSYIVRVFKLKIVLLCARHTNDDTAIVAAANCQSACQLQWPVTGNVLNVKKYERVTVVFV
jgi:hypothetical protein